MVLVDERYEDDEGGSVWWQRIRVVTVDDECSVGSGDGGRNDAERWLKKKTKILALIP